MTDDDAVLDGFVNRVRDAVFRPRPMPGILYHYTTADGFKGIMKSRVICARRTDHTNDPDELGVADAMVREIATRRGMWRALDGVTPAARVCSWLAQCKDAALLRDLTYVACFSEAPDLESQWRKYGDHDRGVCIGFDTGVMPHSLGAVDRWTSGFIPVVYDRKLQRETVRQDLDTLLNEVDRCSKEHPELTDRIVERGAREGVASIAGAAAISYKTEDWQAEKEWRILCFVRPDEPMKRVRGNSSPYVEIPFTSDGGLPPVAEVIVGGCCAASAVVDAESFLLSLGFGVGRPMPRVYRRGSLSGLPA
jgi:hypothetical protein